MLDRRTFIGGALGAAALGALSACGSIAVEDSGSAGVAAAQPLSVCIAPPRSIDPCGATDASSLTVVWQLFDSLTSYDFATGELSCLAAERYEVSDDARTFTFHLRQATFHNGDAVTSADFKRAWERIVDPARAASEETGSSSLASMLSVIEGYAELRAGTAYELAGVSCPDDATLSIALRTPYADFPYVLAHPALGPVPALAEEDPEAFAAKPVGNGPFQMTGTWEPGTMQIELARFDAYAGEPATLASARFEIAEDIEQAFQRFQTDDVDVSRCPVRDAHGAASSLGRVEDGSVMTDDDHFVCCTGLATSMLACNVQGQVLGNADVRRALSLAIDRDYLADTLYRETRFAADGVVSPAITGYQEAVWPYATYDTAHAEELLDALYPVLEDDARGLTVRLLYNADGGHREVIEAVVENLAKVGVICEPEDVDIETLRERVAARDFDLVRMDWATDAPVMDGVLFPLFFSGNVSSTNVSGYHDERVDELLAEARAELDGTRRIALLQEADAAIGRDCPVIPLMFQGTSYVISERIEELPIAPQGRIDLARAQLAE